MSSPPTDEELQVARMIAQSLQCDGGSGASVNHTSNPFIFGLIGQFDTLKMAERIVTGLDQYRENMARAKAELAAQQAKAAALAAQSGKHV